MGVNKVQLSDGTVLMSVEDSANVKGNTMLTGTEAYDENGNKVAGSLVLADITLTKTDEGVVIKATESDGTQVQALIAKGETGPIGPQGEKGETGAKGATGAQGPKGDTGSQGEQGPQGVKGDTGAQGVAGVGVESITQTTTSSADGGSNVITVKLTNGNTSTFKVKNGSKGDKGDTGATGPQGPQGAKGDTGAMGPQGPQGEKGDTGPAGAKGDNPVLTEYTATLSASGWSSSAPYTQTVSVSGILFTDNPVADVVLSSTTATAINELEAWGCVSEITTANGSITANCLEEKPAVALTVRMQVWR